MTDYADVYADQRDFLWGYCYRLTGSAADAEDLVQETFVRALERPPADTARPWRPWLVRVATNLAYDEARKKKRRDYVGPWLPSPIETDAAGAPARPEAPPGWATRLAVAIDVDDAGRVRAVYAVVAPEKLATLR